MEVIASKVGNVEFFIETIDEDISTIGQVSGGRMVKPTGAKKIIKDSYEEVKNLVKSLASDFGETVNGIQDEYRPQKAELKLNLSIGGEAKAWIITSKSNASLNISFTWENKI